VASCLGESAAGMVAAVVAAVVRSALQRLCAAPGQPHWPSAPPVGLISSLRVAYGRIAWPGT